MYKRFEKIFNNYKPDHQDQVLFFLENVKDMIDFISIKKDEKEIIYLSSPMTNVPNYENYFNNLEILCRKLYTDRLCEKSAIIINPLKDIFYILDNDKKYKDLTYNDKMIICRCILSSATILIYNSDDNLYLNSTGVNEEIKFAKENNIEVKNIDWIRNGIKFKEYIDTEV